MGILGDIMYSIIDPRIDFETREIKWLLYPHSTNVVYKILDLIREDGIHFGYVQGMYDEWGSFSQNELESLGAKVWEIKEIDLPHAGRRD